MKTSLPLLLRIAAFTLMAQHSWAERTSSSYSITAEIADAGGLRASSANYTHDGSAATITGISTVAAPAQITKAGYIGQLYEPAGLAVIAAQATVNEGETLQLGAAQLLDDATYLIVPATSVTWGVPGSPIASIDPAGLATAELVYQDTPAAASGTFGGFTGTLDLTVLDSIPDNFGAYAGDALDDDWQVLHFGLDNPLAAPGLDPDGDGQDNLFEFTAGLLPTDATSVFHLRIAKVPNAPTHKDLIFLPLVDGRTYTVEYRLSLTAGDWQPLGGTSFLDVGDTRTLTDPNATDSTRFYRVLITVP